MMDLLFLVRWMVRERVSVSLMRDEREGWIAELDLGDRLSGLIAAAGFGRSRCRALCELSIAVQDAES